MTHKNELSILATPSPVNALCPQSTYVVMSPKNSNKYIPVMGCQMVIYTRNFCFKFGQLT